MSLRAKRVLFVGGIVVAAAIGLYQGGPIAAILSLVALASAVPVIASLKQ